MLDYQVVSWSHLLIHVRLSFICFAASAAGAAFSGLAGALLQLKEMNIWYLSLRHVSSKESSYSSSARHTFTHTDWPKRLRDTPAEPIFSLTGTSSFRKDLRASLGVGDVSKESAESTPSANGSKLGWPRSSLWMPLVTLEQQK